MTRIIEDDNFRYQASTGGIRNRPLHGERKTFAIGNIIGSKASQGIVFLDVELHKCKGFEYNVPLFQSFPDGIEFPPNGTKVLIIYIQDEKESLPYALPAYLNTSFTLVPLEGETVRLKLKGSDYEQQDNQGRHHTTKYGEIIDTVEDIE